MISVISEIFKEDKDSLIVDLNDNDSLIIDFHNQDQDSRIADLHNHDSLGVALDSLMVDLHNQDQDSRIIAVHKKDSLCMYMFTYVALFEFKTTLSNIVISVISVRRFLKTIIKH